MASSLSAVGGCGASASASFAASGGGAAGAAARGPAVFVSFTDFQIRDFLKEHFKTSCYAALT